jgi:alcohol dehydrogenase class IV
MHFEFATATRIIFGINASWEAGELAASMGQKVLVVTGATETRSNPLLARLESADVAHHTLHVSGEPTIELAREGTAQAREAGCDLVIGIGGGSALDTGKAIAALLTNDGDPLDYLEVIGEGKPLTQPSTPYIAIPTTAGPGAEVTRNAVLASREHRVKVSLRSPFMLPRVALIDPALTYSMPPDITAKTGLDALSQVIEPYLSARANPLVDAICREGIRLAGPALRFAYHDGADTQARANMCLVSLFGGLALANAGLGAVHGFAGPFGGMFDAPHGAVCAALLPSVMAVNYRAMQARQPDTRILQRFSEVARILTGDPQATVEEGIAWLADLTLELCIPGLGAYDFTEAHFDALIEKASVSSSMRANPIELTPEEMREILSRAL